MDKKSKLPQSFDAMDWVDEFDEIVRKNPSIPFDRDKMLCWFSNAIMAGWDEHARRVNCILQEDSITIKKSRLEADWTWEGHFAYDSFNCKDPQLCIKASGWKARILGFIFRARK
jgi:hypothetical protein